MNQNIFDKVIKNLECYERPDILSMFDNEIVAIEHFEFDSYNRDNKKGSDFKIKNFRIEDRFIRKVKEQIEEKQIVIHDKIESTAFLKNIF